ncbi:hypothetical protein B0H16DRAFT_693247 [Mycena metata]|uniref:Uncharacterized protein n=1 Tax=Mycena metata TaxID=1033252 RepID=A0AAD7J4H0_9AGAR|nr:hypothetical protein B0H16DRAFT_693247 [Mycena metata]
MQRPVSSSDSSVDDSGVQDFKAAEAAQFRKLTGSPTKFKEAQADALRADSIRQTPTKKPRSNSLGQTTPAPRTRSTPQTQTPTSAAQLLKLLGSDSKDTRQLLHSALAQLDASSRRLAHSDAERRALESAQLAQTTQTLQAASAVQRNAVAAQAEVSLYRLQMESAQQEILRAQEVVRSLEMQRDDAERAATKARTMARRLHADKMALLAKEQGRKEGYETGFGHGHVIAVEKERRRNEQRRLEAEIQRRQLASAPPSEPRGAFIEEHIPSGDLSRNVSNAQPPAPTELERRQRRVSSDSASIIRPLPPADPSVAAEPPPPPVNYSSPRSQRPPSTATSSSRRVSAPPAVPQQQQPPARVRTSSIDGSRTSRAYVANVVPNDTLNRSNSASTQRPRRSDPVPNDNTLNRSNSASTQRPRQNSAANRQSMPTPAPAAPHIPVPIQNIQERPQRRPSVRSASTSTFDSDPVGAAPGVSTGAGVRQTRRPSLVEAMMPRVIPMPPPPMHLPVPTSVSASTSTSGFGFGSTQTRVQMPEPITMPAHVPMPRPPPGAIPAQAFPPSPAGQTFEVERPRQQQQQPRSPSSVSTISLGTKTEMGADGTRRHHRDSRRPGRAGARRILIREGWRSGVGERTRRLRAINCRPRVPSPRPACSAPTRPSNRPRTTCMGSLVRTASSRPLYTARRAGARSTSPLCHLPVLNPSPCQVHPTALPQRVTSHRTTRTIRLSCLRRKKTTTMMTTMRMMTTTVHRPDSYLLI